MAKSKLKNSPSNFWDRLYEEASEKKKKIAEAEKKKEREILYDEEGRKLFSPNINRTSATKTHNPNFPDELLLKGILFMFLPFMEKGMELERKKELLRKKHDEEYLQFSPRIDPNSERLAAKKVKIKNWKLNCEKERPPLYVTPPKSARSSLRESEKTKSKCLSETWAAFEKRKQANVNLIFALLPN